MQIVKATPSAAAVKPRLAVPSRPSPVSAKAIKHDREEQADLRSVAMGAFAAFLLAMPTPVSAEQLDALTGSPPLGQKQPNQAVPEAILKDLPKADDALVKQPTGAVRQAAQDVRELVEQQASALNRPSGPDDNKAEQLVKSAGEKANQKVEKLSNATDKVKDKSRNILDKTGDLVRGIANKADQATSNSGNIKAQPTDPGVEAKGFFNKGTIGSEMKSKGLFSMLPLGTIGANDIAGAADRATDKAQGAASDAASQAKGLASEVANKASNLFNANTPSTGDVRRAADKAGAKAQGVASDVANKTSNLFQGGEKPLGRLNAENQRAAAARFENLVENRRQANGGSSGATANINLLGEGKAKRGGFASLPVNVLPLGNIATSKISDAADKAQDAASNVANKASNLFNANTPNISGSDVRRAADKAQGVASDVANKTSNLFQGGEKPLGRLNAENQRAAAARFENLVENRRQANGGSSGATANINLLGEGKAKRGGFASLPVNVLPLGSINADKIGDAADAAGSKAKGVGKAVKEEVQALLPGLTKVDSQGIQNRSNEVFESLAAEGTKPTAGKMPESYTSNVYSGPGTSNVKPLAPNKAKEQVSLLPLGAISASDIGNAAENAASKVKGAASEAGSRAQGAASNVANKSSNLFQAGSNPLGRKVGQIQAEAASSFESLVENRRRANGGSTGATSNINSLGESKAKRVALKLGGANPLVLGLIKPDTAAPDTSSSIADLGKKGREAAEQLVNATEGRTKGQFTAQQGGENTDPQKNINERYKDANQTNPEVQADNKRKDIFNQRDPARDNGMPGEEVTDQSVQGVQSNFGQLKSILGL